MSLSGTSGRWLHFARKATPLAVRVRRVGHVLGRNGWACLLMLPRPLGISKANPPVQAKKSCVFVHLCLWSANEAELYSVLCANVDCCRVAGVGVAGGVAGCFTLNSLVSLVTSSPNSLAEAHCRQAVNTTSSGAYTPVIIHLILQSRRWRRPASS